MKDHSDCIKKRAGTSFRGYLISTYKQLCSVFGEPTSKGDGYKVDVEWLISTPSGIATIYNYKDGHAYLGDRGLDTEKICEWHVGGKNTESYEWIKEQLFRSIDLYNSSGG